MRDIDEEFRKIDERKFETLNKKLEQLKIDREKWNKEFKELVYKIGLEMYNKEINKNKIQEKKINQPKYSNNFIKQDKSPKTKFFESKNNFSFQNNTAKDKISNIDFSKTLANNKNPFADILKKSTSSIFTEEIEKKEETPISAVSDNSDKSEQLNIPTQTEVENHSHDKDTEQPNIDNSTKEETIFTNIPLTQHFIDTSINTKEYSTILKLIENDRNKIQKGQQNKIILTVSKRVSQITTDTNQIDKIIQTLDPIKNSYIFMEYLSNKIIEQARVQVSQHKDSYKSYAYLLSKIYDQEKTFDSLCLIFKNKIITSKIEEKSIKGVYLIYFGLLDIKNNLKESWFFLAGLLNVEPNHSSFYVLESFLSVLGDKMLEEYKERFIGLLKYIRDTYLKMFEDEPSRVRIENLTTKIINKK
ncbi:hypothetical protein SLOPH_1784 [Spraguea lophii 42_110]|uniref:Uncharacterized protein n=1 Tax=Spraguea lophii (strain 42_110) TaxID=1358809 RepID=S7XTI6_SPRLO|nr:hypothetical protein SLOPH_1784 [Spraguea lophii 42_110]